MSKVSIIMPTYGVEKYISIAIDKILNQEVEDWNLIVVDDGTKDHSAEIAQEYANRDPRIKVVHKENGGLSSARNFGLKFATGKYVTFFDPDDYAEPYFLSSLLVPVKEDKEPDLIIGGYIVKYESGVVKYETRDIPVDLFRNLLNSNRRNSNIQSEISNLKAKRSQNCESKLSQFVNYAWNKLFRREFLLQHNLTYEEGLYRIEDAEFMSRLIKHNPMVDFVKNCGYVYVQRPVTTLSNVFDEIIIDHAVRRIGIDVEVLSFFNNLSDEDKPELERSLRQSSVSALLSRIYHQNGIDKETKYFLLDEIRNRQLPQRVKLTDKTLKQILRYLALKSLQKKLYKTVDFIYRFA